LAHRPNTLCGACSVDDHREQLGSGTVRADSLAALAQPSFAGLPGTAWHTVDNEKDDLRHMGPTP